MTRTLILALCLICPLALLAQHEPHSWHASGYITSVAPDGSFALEGTSVRLDAHTAFTEGAPPFIPFVGEFVELDSLSPHGKHATAPILATRITVRPPIGGAIHSKALIDLVPAPVGSDHLVRADGRFLRIPTTASLKFDPPLTAANAFATNVWIQYQGFRQVDGSVLVDTAAFHANALPLAEEHLHTKQEYDPAAVKPEAAQGVISKEIFGLDPKRYPAHHDEVLSARISRIGASLVPACQRTLTAADPNRIDFRFQIVDIKDFHEPEALSNGIILVPFAGLDPKKSDAELAPPLAVAMATVLEKEEFRGRFIGAVRNFSGTTTTALILSGGMGAGIAGVKLLEHLGTVQIEQADRVALSLLHDAGYNPGLAPKAIWDNIPRDASFPDPNPPGRVITLLKELGSTWQPGSLASTH